MPHTDIYIFSCGGQGSENLQNQFVQKLRISIQSLIIHNVKIEHVQDQVVDPDW